ncbi:MAG: ribonuclease III [Pseudomonadota bacterium]|nr:ribonuclease III [Pseudomonadota bacterium]
MVTEATRHPLERLLGLSFTDSTLLQEALTHKSAGTPNYERLEFLGDAVLELVVTEQIYRLHPTLDEGAMTRMRVALVRRESLAEVAKRLQLGRYLQFGQGERKSGGMHRASILADSFEALVGAVYLDGGFEVAREVIKAQFDWDKLQTVSADGLKDSKTRLQEWLQAQNLPLPDYGVVKTEGREHDRVFTVRLTASALNEAVEASASSIKWAEQAAAALALEQLEH